MSRGVLAAAVLTHQLPPWPQKRLLGSDGRGRVSQPMLAMGGRSVGKPGKEQFQDETKRRCPDGSQVLALSPPHVTPPVPFQFAGSAWFSGVGTFPLLSSGAVFHL